MAEKIRVMIPEEEVDAKIRELGQKISEKFAGEEAETRMGSGKGALEYWVAVVKPGRVLFEIAGVPEETAKEALRLAMHKLPCKCKIVSKADLEGGDNSEN